METSLIAAKARVLASAGGALPAEFYEPVVVNAEMVRDLMDDGTADLVRDLLLGLADDADRLAIDGDPVGEDARIIRCTAGQGDALVKSGQAWRARVVLDGHRDVAHQPPEILGQPVQCRDDHFLKPAGFDVHHQPIVRPGRSRAGEP